MAAVALEMEGGVRMMTALRCVYRLGRSARLQNSKTDNQYSLSERKKNTLLEEKQTKFEIYVVSLIHKTNG